MTEVKHKSCFGSMFPEAFHGRDPGAVQGKVFSIRERPSGGLAGPIRTVEAAVNQWDDCQTCPEFDSCYKLSVGKAIMQSVIREG
jgi:hypothetical protein